LTRGRFITIEGVEGVGKSTNIAFIQSLLNARNIDSITTREPGGTGLGELIRNVLLDKSQHQMSAMTELLLMFAARTQHIEQTIEPALAIGKWVICDRFTDSSYAYQGGGRNMSMNLIAQLEKLSISNFQPDCTIILDLPVDAGLSRAESVGEKDRFESESTEFFNRVRQVFVARAEKEDRAHIINAAAPLAEVQDHIRRILDPFLKHNV
jgi:dTMP kinase